MILIEELCFTVFRKTAVIDANLVSIVNIYLQEKQWQVT